MVIHIGRVGNSNSILYEPFLVFCNATSFNLGESINVVVIQQGKKTPKYKLKVI